MAEFIKDKGKFILVSFVYTEYALGTEEEVNITELQKVLASVVEKNKFKAKKLYLSISGQSVFTRFAKLPMAIKSKQQKSNSWLNMKQNKISYRRSYLGLSDNTKCRRQLRCNERNVRRNKNRYNNRLGNYFRKSRI